MDNQPLPDSLNLTLVKVAYMYLDDLRDDAVGQVSGEVVSRYPMPGGQALVFDHRRNPEALARVEAWIPGVDTEGDLRAVVAICDARLGAKASSTANDLDRFLAKMPRPLESPQTMPLTAV